MNTTARSCRANTSGHVLYRWTDGGGNEWACAAYDHGPFCRLCSLVDPSMAAQLADVEVGAAEVWTEADGALTFTKAES